MRIGEILLIFARAALSGTLLGAALWTPGSYQAFILAIAGVVTWVKLCKSGFLFAGVVQGLFFYGTALCWSPQTIDMYTGLGVGRSYLVFLVLCLAQSSDFFIATAISSRLVFPGILALLEFSILYFNLRCIPWNFGYVLSPESYFVKFLHLENSMIAGVIWIWLIECLVFMLDLKTKRHVLRYGLIFVFGVAVALPLIKYSPDPYDPITKGAFVRVRIVHPIESSYGDEVQSVSSSLESRNEGWLNQKDNDSILLKDMEESSASATPGTLIIWPEETLGNDLNLDVEKDNLQLLLPTIPKETYLLSGVRTFSKQGRFTSAVLVAPERRFVDVVHKEKLMPIGESLPLIVEPIFRWFGLFPEYIYMLSPSRESRHTMEITVGGRSIRLGILICFEEVYDIDEFDLHDVDILIGLSKNFVLGEIAQSQQEAVAKWRAVESGKTLVRASFGGRSSVILPNGEVMNSMERNVKYTDFDVPIF